MIIECGGFRIDLNQFAPAMNFQQTKTFPPKPGEWFQAPDTVILGCLRSKCGSLYSVNPACHTIQPDGQLIPSWTCVNCGSHVVVRLAGYIQGART